MTKNPLGEIRESDAFSVVSKSKKLFWKKDQDGAPFQANRRVAQIWQAIELHGELDSENPFQSE